MPENQFYLPNFLKFCDNISHKLLRPTQFLGKFWKFWNGPLCRNKSGPFPLLNVAIYWQSSNTKACTKKLSQILANNINNGGRGIGLRIYGRYCRLVKRVWYSLNKYFVGIKLKKYSILSIHINKWHVLADLTSLKCCFLKAVVFPCCLTLTSMTHLLH